MSHAFPRARRLARATAASAIACAAVLGGASAAQAACATQATTKAFAAFGDNADYVLAPGGNFEPGSAPWSLSGGSALASANATLSAAKTTDRSSLTVSAKGIAVSPTFCVGIEHPTFRFQARQVSGTWAQLLVKLRWRQSASAAVNETVVGSLTGTNYAKWTPVPSLKLAQTLPLTGTGQTIIAQIVLDPEDAGGNWQVDNVYVDPYRRQ